MASHEELAEIVFGRAVEPAAGLSVASEGFRIAAWREQRATQAQAELLAVRLVHLHARIDARVVNARAFGVEPLTDTTRLRIFAGNLIPGDRQRDVDAGATGELHAEAQIVDELAGDRVLDLVG